MKAGGNFKRLLTATTAVCAVLAGASLLSIPSKQLHAQEAPGNLPALINAQDVQYDQELGLVVARGNVEISQGDRVVIADQVSYNVNSNLVTANGNVSLLEPSGEVIFADHVELTDDLKEGFIKDIRILLTDKSRLAGVTGQLTNGNRSVLSNGVFSPCNLCENDPTRPPIWQIKAGEVIHDKADQSITYYDAKLELFGIPVAYTPWLETPDPTVKRRSGFLAPSFSSSGDLGQTLQTPYYFAIDDSSSFTFAPIITTKQGVVAAGNYERAFSNGDLDVDFSATYADRTDNSGTDQAFRGHIDLEGRFDINDTWRWGVDLERASDEDYLARYGFSNPDTYESSLFVEGFRGRNFARVDSYAFQSLRDNVNDSEIPVVAPRFQYSFQSEPTSTGLTTRFDSNAVLLTRSEGRDTARLSAVTGIDLPYTGPAGDVYKLTAQVQTDAYYTRDFVPGSLDVNPTGPTENEFSGRIFPQLALEWRYPFVSNQGDFAQTIEPIVQGIAAPAGSNPNEIPNDDSADFEFDDTSLFSLNRFSGRDLVDSGSRVNYGVKWAATTERGDTADILVGQSYRFTDDSLFDQIDGLDDSLSDYVGHIGIETVENFSALYRFRVDKDDFRVRRNEFNVGAGPEALRVTLNYLDLQDTNFQDDEDDSREELRFSVSSQLTEFWSTSASLTRDLETEDTRNADFNLTYHDECFIISSGLSRSFSTRTDVENDTIFTVQLVFKHLGSIQPF